MRLKKHPKFKNMLRTYTKLRKGEEGYTLFFIFRPSLVVLKFAQFEPQLLLFSSCQLYTSALSQTF